MPDPQKPMTQKDFLEKLRAEVPDLGSFDDATLMNEVFKRRPELRTRIENPMAGDAAAAAAQGKAEARSRSLVDPEFWKDKPRLKGFANSVLSALPGAGAILGGAAATPETFGGGTIAGGALGAGVGRGTQDLISQGLGLSDTSPMQKVGNIALDTGVAAVTPGIAEGVMHPIDTARMGARAYMSLTPKGLQPYIHPEALENFAKGALGGSSKRIPWVSNFAKEAPVVEGEIVPPGGIKGGRAFTEGEIPVTEGRPSPMEGAKRLGSKPEPPPMGPKRLGAGTPTYYGGTQTGNVMKGPLTSEQLDQLSQLDRFVESVMRNR